MKELKQLSFFCQNCGKKIHTFLEDNKLVTSCRCGIVIAITKVRDGFNTKI